MNSLFAGIAISVAILFPSNAFATSQAPDRLIIDGERVSLQTNPLRPLVASKKITIPEADESWSSNWRGYTATWELKGDQFVLTEIMVLLVPKNAEDKAEAVSTNVLSEVFQGQKEVLATWYSGTLVIPRGKVTRYVHMGYASTHERYTIVRIKEGRSVDRTDLTEEQYTALRKERFSQYKKTPEYATRLKEARSDLSAKASENFLFEYAVEEYMSVEP